MIRSTHSIGGGVAYLLLLSGTVVVSMAAQAHGGE
jgi:hypothetical protein